MPEIGGVTLIGSKRGGSARGVLPARAPFAA
jgi:hypothetical protein